MDVRCEQCGTEYELDESRLKPGGVTVKCTSCGHMFKIRKRAPTNVGIPVPQHGAPSAPVPRQPTGQTAIPRAQTNTGSGPAGDRNWIVRLHNGEQRTCRELATLQQWIIAGDVTRDSMISRSGKTWKQLGDIPELAQFFDVADEARDERVRRESARVTGPVRPKPATPDVKQTMLGIGGGMPPGPPPGAPPRRPATQPPPPPKASAGPSAGQSAGSTMPNGLPKSAPANDGEVPTLPRAKIGTPAAAPGAPAQFGGPPGAPQKLQTPPRGTSSAAAPPRPVGPSKPPAMPSLPTDAAARSTGAWATKDVKQFAEEQSAAGPAGPAGGQARLTSSQLGMAEPAFGNLGTLKSVPTDDVAFASSLNKRGGLDAFSAPEHLDDETTGPVLARGAGGGLGKWIAIGSLAVIAGAAIAIYALVIRGGSSDTRAAAAPLDAGLAASDAAVIATAIDAGTTVTPVPGDDVLENAAEGLRADTVTALEAAAAQLAEGATAEDPARLALRARIATAIVQDLEDEATFTSDAKAATKLRADAKKRLVDAATLAQKAVKKAAGTDAEALANVAMADVLRLQGKGAKDVKKSLDRAPKDDREAKLVGALLAAREGKTADAKAALQELDRGDGSLEKSGDVRARFRLAALAFTANDKDAAKTAAEQVVAVQPDHAGARALLTRLRDAVSTNDPMPPEDNGGSTTTGGGTTTSGSGGTKPSGGGSEPKGDDYDALLAKADQLAEVNCSQAMPYYQKALAVKANGVAALTGIGYCYVDAKQFSSAHSSFRAALAVSRRYEPALWGVAEAYQQQGLKEKAIDAYQAYLEAYPGTQKAIKQIERLGGTVDGGGGGTKPPDEPPTPPVEPTPEEPKTEPVPTPTPTPAPAPEGGATNPS
jgi:predicted Zn finger-like uncharacterized protein